MEKLINYKVRVQRCVLTIAIMPEFLRDGSKFFRLFLQAQQHGANYLIPCCFKYAYEMR